MKMQSVPKRGGLFYFCRTMFNKTLLFVSLLAGLTFSCQQKKAETATDHPGQASYIKYASGLVIARHSDWTEVVVKQPWKGAGKAIRYALVDKKSDAHTAFEGYTIVKVPLTKVAATSTTHLPHFSAIGEVYSLKGFANADYVYSKVFQSRLESGELVEIGDGAGVNFESCLNLKPEALFTFSMGNDRSTDERLEQAGIDMLYNADYLETTPLGRAEWIKFTAAFFNKLDEADSIFNVIEQNYLELKAEAQKAEAKPTVLTGVVYGDTWFLPGGKNYGAAFFEDAGGNYLWKETDENGWLELSFESVFEKGLKADYWFGVASFTTLQEMKAQESRYGLFSAWKNSAVYNYDNQLNKKGGNNYLEEGYSRPDIVLADLIHIMHPELLPDHKLYFYRKLP
ncbi:MULTISPECIES: ABC transporter substrate-binding protein [unclassified Imperialibacter]|uniref:ABC transporter substrate-binding protein n=1 Tax=unclassified Imperialibacter TaxID=2629706 RepID=UPI00125FF0EF|nr:MULTISPECIES: ABC transporter substrate-binding protein [unclassified Imperialibacter]CAD5273294.1 Vitamin B12-transporter protein BtuF [Imperialibacter sp. 89]CAD5288964.1 Vitamin B12-transporter protein BtuF [Imperialibacter sp. 75]